MTALTAERPRSVERLLADFAPGFDFVPAPPIPVAKYAERMRRVKREGAAAGRDALLVHPDTVGWFHAGNACLRYLCDWMREGVLVIPMDEDKGPVLAAFYTQSVILPPGGEPVGVERILQLGAIGREYADIPGDSAHRTVEAAAKVLKDFGLARDSLGVIGDRRTAPFKAALAEAMPGAAFSDRAGVLDRMQRIRTPAEIAVTGAAAELVSIATQAACHVARPGVTDHEVFAALTFAQMARGGETGDGRQIGANEWGTHCGKPNGRAPAPGRPRQPLCLERRPPGLHRADHADDRAGRADRAAGAGARRLRPRRQGGGEADPAGDADPRPQRRRLRALCRGGAAPGRGGAHHALRLEHGRGRGPARDPAAGRARRRPRGAGAAADAGLSGHLRVPRP